MKNLSSSGFTLVEIMIASAALAGLSLVAMQMTQTQTKSTTKASFDSEKLLIKNEINGILSDPIKCVATFGSTATPTSINGKYFIKGNASAPAQGYGNANIQISSYTLSGTAPDGLLTIAFDNKKILQGSAGATSIPLTINLYIQGSPGAITKCRSISTGMQDIWMKGAGTHINDIFFNTGNVGIGTNAPAWPLEVRSNANARTYAAVRNDSVGNTGASGFLATNDSGATVSIIVPGSAFNVVGENPSAGVNVQNWGIVQSGVSAEGLFLSVNANKPMLMATNNVERMRILGNGNVGIGTTTPIVALDVTGGIRAGASTAVTSCGMGQANGEGSQRYNYTTHKMEFCNGTMWSPVGGSSLSTVDGASPSCPVGTSLLLKYWPSQWSAVAGVGAGCTTTAGWSGVPPICEGCNNFEQCHFGYATSWSSVLCQ